MISNFELRIQLKLRTLCAEVVVVCVGGTEVLLEKGKVAFKC